MHPLISIVLYIFRVALYRTMDHTGATTATETERSSNYNSRFLGRLHENMFFSVANYQGKPGKTLFSNPTEYARCSKQILGDGIHSRFKLKVQRFLDSIEGDQKTHMNELNPTWGTYTMELRGIPTVDIGADEFHESNKQEPLHTEGWVATIPPSGRWADYDD